MFTQSNKRLLVKTACVLSAAMVLLASIPSPAGAPSDALKYRLKPAAGDPTAIEVTVSLDLQQGEQVFLRRFDAGSSSWEPRVEPSLEFAPNSNPAYSLEPLPDGSGWVVSAMSSGPADVAYTVRFPTGMPPLKREDAPESPQPPRYVFGDGLSVFRAHDALLRVLKAPGATALAQDCTVQLEPPSGQKALVPWPLEGSRQGTYAVSGEGALFQQLICWGRLDTVEVRDREPVITAGFAGDYQGDARKRQEYADSLGDLYDELERPLGERPDADRITVLVAPGAEYGVKGPAGEAMFTSTALFTSGALKGESAASAARVLFGLWNGWTMLPKPGGDAGWFQAGIPWLYGYRVAARAGMMSGSEAYNRFSGVYAGYLEDPAAGTQSLSEAEESGNGSLLRDKGAALCASVSVRLPAESQRTPRDIDWLVGQVASGFNALEGKRYTLADLSEILENATGRSWDAYLSDRVRASDLIGADEFSTTQVFGVSTTAEPSSQVPGRSSGKAWIYLVIAVVVIMLIPLVLGAYVRRAVKLDLTMPKILPDDDDEEY